MRVVITGDRNWMDEDMIRRRLLMLPSGTEIIHGDNGNDEETVGVDRIAGRIGHELGLDVKKMPAHWRHRNCPPDCTQLTGKVAGPIRNRAMLTLKPDLVIAFHEDLRRSKGTKDTLKAAISRDIPFEVLPFRDDILKEIFS